jgi:hypothetical protein
MGPGNGSRLKKIVRIEFLSLTTFKKIKKQAMYLKTHKGAPHDMPFKKTR